MAVPVFAFDFFVPPCGGSGVCVCVCVCVLACVRLFVLLGRSSPLGSWGACVLLLFFAPPTHRKRGDKNHDGDDEQIFSPSRLFSTSRRHQRMSLRLTNEPLCDPSPIFFSPSNSPAPQNRRRSVIGSRFCGRFSNQRQQQLSFKCNAIS